MPGVLGNCVSCAHMVPTVREHGQPEDDDGCWSSGIKTSMDISTVVHMVWRFSQVDGFFVSGISHQLKWWWKPVSACGQRQI